MYLLVNVLERSEQLPRIMERFAKIGITGSTVLDSTGMGRVLMKTRAKLPMMQQIKAALDPDDVFAPGRLPR